MTFMAKLLMLSLLLLGISACGLAQSFIPLEVQPTTRWMCTAHATRARPWSPRFPESRCMS